MAKLDKDLAGALKTAKTKSMHFALVEKTPGEGTLIVSKNPVPQSAIAEAQKDLGGGGKIFKGQCAIDAKTGELVFEGDGSEPPVRTLKAVIARDAGMASLKINARKAKPGVSIDDVLNAIQDDDAKQAEQRLDDIVKSRTYQKTKSLGGIEADALKKMTEAAKRLIDQKAFKQADEAMAKLKAFAEKPTETM